MGSTYAPRTTPAHDPRTYDVQAELEWFTEVSPSWGWHWASTFAKFAPHSYVVKNRHVGAADYERAVRLVLALGQPRKYWKRVNIELHLDHLTLPFGPRGGVRPHTGVKLWPMSNRISVSKTLNMAPVHFSYGTQDAPSTRSLAVTPYDGLAPDWDDLRDEYLGQAYESVKHPLKSALWKRIVDQDYVADVLDVGARTGLALDLNLVRGEEKAYAALEPSQPMLNQLVWKHQWVKDVWPMTAGDYLDNQPPSRTHDTVVSLLGSASYLKPEEVRELSRRATRLAAFMHYDDSAEPDFFGTPELPDYAVASREAAAALPGARVEQLGRFQLVTVRPE